jgi:hypothetical protein
MELGLCLCDRFERADNWIADAHRGDGKRFVVRADEKLTAFIELESALRTGQRFAASPWLDALVH